MLFSVNGNAYNPQITQMDADKEKTNGKVAERSNSLLRSADFFSPSSTDHVLRDNVNITFGIWS